MPLDELESKVLRVVVARFMNLKEPTNRKDLLTQYRSVKAVNRLVSVSALRPPDHNGNLVPSALGISYDNDLDSLTQAKSSLEIVLHVLQNLYEVNPPRTRVTLSDVKAHADKIYDHVPPGAIERGLYFATEFSVLESFGFEPSQRPQDAARTIDWMLISEQIVEVNPRSAWDEHVRNHEAILEKITGVTQAPTPNQSEPVTKPEVLVLISHSSKDADAAAALVEYLRAGLLINKIRCSSVDGYRLPAGVNTEAQLKAEVNSAEVMIGLITPNSLASAYVMFELGARWGVGKFMIPLLAGATTQMIREPLSLLNSLRADNDSQLHQLIGDVGKELRITAQEPATYVKQLAALRDSCRAITGPIHDATAIAAQPETERDSSVSLSVERVPPEPQILRVQAKLRVRALKLDYVLSTGPCLATDILNLEGESFDVPINDSNVAKLWNAMRPDRNAWDNSGPAKLRLILSIRGKERPYTLPIQMDSYHHGNANYRRLLGSEVFP
jgi:hypothetical protein